MNQIIILCFAAFISVKAGHLPPPEYPKLEYKGVEIEFGIDREDGVITNQVGDITANRSKLWFPIDANTKSAKVSLNIAENISLFAFGTYQSTLLHKEQIVDKDWKVAVFGQPQYLWAESYGDMNFNFQKVGYGASYFPFDVDFGRIGIGFRFQEEKYHHANINSKYKSYDADGNTLNDGLLQRNTLIMDTKITKNIISLLYQKKINGVSLDFNYILSGKVSGNYHDQHTYLSKHFVADSISGEMTGLIANISYELPLYFSPTIYLNYEKTSLSASGEQHYYNDSGSLNGSQGTHVTQSSEIIRFGMKAKF